MEENNIKIYFAEQGVELLLPKFTPKQGSEMTVTELAEEINKEFQINPSDLKFLKPNG